LSLTLYSMVRPVDRAWTVTWSSSVTQIKRTVCTIVQSEYLNTEEVFEFENWIKNRVALCLQNNGNYCCKFQPFKQVMKEANTCKDQPLRLSLWCHWRFGICGMWLCANVGLLRMFGRIIVPSCLWSCSHSCPCRPHTLQNSFFLYCAFCLVFRNNQQMHHFLSVHYFT
jgi:hypothetical protein